MYISDRSDLHYVSSAISLGYPLITRSLYHIIITSFFILRSLSLFLSLSLSIYIYTYIYKKNITLPMRPSPPALIISPPRNTCPVTAFLLTCVHATHCSQGKNEYRAARAIHIGGRGQPDNDGVQIEAEPYLHIAAYPYLIRECRTYHQGNECVCHHSSSSLRSILYDLFIVLSRFQKNLLRISRDTRLGDRS